MNNFTKNNFYNEISDIKINDCELIRFESFDNLINSWVGIARGADDIVDLSLLTDDELNRLEELSKKLHNPKIPNNTDVKFYFTSEGFTTFKEIVYLWIKSNVLDRFRTVIISKPNKVYYEDKYQVALKQSR